MHKRKVKWVRHLRAKVHRGHGETVLQPKGRDPAARLQPHPALLLALIGLLGADSARWLSRSLFALWLVCFLLSQRAESAHSKVQWIRARWRGKAWSEGGRLSPLQQKRAVALPSPRWTQSGVHRSDLCIEMYRRKDLPGGRLRGAAVGTRIPVKKLLAAEDVTVVRGLPRPPCRSSASNSCTNSSCQRSSSVSGQSRRAPSSLPLNAVW